MDFKISTILYATVALLLISSYSHAASTTNGKLLKFYPITKQQYKSILALAKQQPAVSEGHLKESHRSLADWSNTLHNSWNSLFNGTTNKTSGQNDGKAYPICVIKTKDPIVRRKRGTVKNQYDADYAGLAPNVVYPRFYYPNPPFHGYPSNGGQAEGENDTDTDDNVDDEADNEENEGGENIEVEEDIPANNENDNNNEAEKDSNTPIINCVVVLRRNNQDTIISPFPDDEEDDDDDLDIDIVDDDDSPSSYELPPYPRNAYPYPYPPPIPPHGLYPHPYPSQRYEISRNSDDPSFRNNKFPVIDPVRYHEMLREYYKHLQAFYMTDAATGTQGSNE